MMRGYSTREAAQLVGLSHGRVRAFARAGLLSPARDERRHYHFSFRDIILLRAARDLEAAQLHPRRVHRALRSLQQRLTPRQPLSGVRITCVGNHVVVREAGRTWQPENGQNTFDFSLPTVTPPASVLVAAPEPAGDEDTATTAEEWFLLGLDLEAIGEEDRAMVAYAQAVSLDAGHAEAQINLGRLLHEAGGVEDAERCYREALRSVPQHPTALFNLGVALEDGSRITDAMRCYRQAIAADPDHADAHFNLARLCEQMRDTAGAFRHRRRYHDLTRPDS
jgi:tetratricopeptide (TPR) repeat protein